jgi:predicted esterase
VRRARTPTSLLLVALLASACAGRTLPTPAERLHAAAAIAEPAGLEPAPAGTRDALALPIAAWMRPARRGAVAADTAGDPGVHVYIEGDGLAWRTRRRVSDDPTPVDPVALRLAAADRSDAAVVYLGRPCQYRPASAPPCSARFWTAERFADAVVDAMDRRLDALVAAQGERRPLALVGYSGGGVVAALLAARRDDVALLVTLAAPLDVEHWTRSTGTSPLAGSLSPMDAIEALAHTPQLHFVGELDRVVPREATERLVAALPSGAPARVVVVRGMDHRGWPERWTALVRDHALWPTGSD